MSRQFMCMVTAMIPVGAVHGKHDIRARSADNVDHVWGNAWSCCQTGIGCNSKCRWSGIDSVEAVLVLMFLLVLCVLMVWSLRSLWIYVDM